ncbi:MAG: NADH-quinone oxidoreductase subunit NuoE [Bacteroidota bacterium]
MNDKIKSILQRFPNARRDDLIPILQQIQEEAGYLSEDSITAVGTFLNLPTSKIHGIATFYNQFSFIPLGKYHIRICRGTGCHVESGLNIVKELEKQLKVEAGEVTKDNLFSYELVSCLGACSKGPVISVNDTYYTRVSVQNIKDIIQSFRQKEEAL